MLTAALSVRTLWQSAGTAPCGIHSMFTLARTYQQCHVAVTDVKVQIRNRSQRAWLSLTSNHGLMLVRILIPYSIVSFALCLSDCIVCCRFCGLRGTAGWPARLTRYSSIWHANMSLTRKTHLSPCHAIPLSTGVFYSIILIPGESSHRIVQHHHPAPPARSIQNCCNCCSLPRTFLCFAWIPK